MWTQTCSRRVTAVSICSLLSILLLSCGRKESDKIRVTLETESNVSVSTDHAAADQYELVFEDRFTPESFQKNWKIVTGNYKIDNQRVLVNENLHIQSNWTEWSNDNRIVLKVKPLSPVLNAHLHIFNPFENKEYGFAVTQSQSSAPFDLWRYRTEEGSMKWASISDVKMNSGIFELELVQNGHDMSPFVAGRKYDFPKCCPIFAKNTIDLRFEGGNYELVSISVFERVMPKNASLLDMGKRYLWKGKTDLAVNIFQDILKSAQDNNTKVGAEYFIAQCHITDKRYADALKQLKYIGDNYPFDEMFYPLLQFDLSRMYYLIGDLETSYREFEKFLKKYNIPELNYSSYFYLGSIAEQRKKYDEAVKYYRMFIKDNPVTSVASEKIRPFFKKYYPDYFKSKGVYFSPANVAGREEVDIFFNPHERDFLAGSDTVNTFIGINGWMEIQTLPMKRQPDGLYRLQYRVKPYCREINFVFNDGGSRWDNNEGLDWFISGRDDKHPYDYVSMTAVNNTLTVTYDHGNPNAILHDRKDIAIHYWLDNYQTERSGEMEFGSAEAVYSVKLPDAVNKVILEFWSKSAGIWDTNFGIKYVYTRK